jgi:cysteine desulfurase/selenocysteine lyase
LDEQNIMCRSGYFCCHSSLLHDKKLPPLLRVSLGLHNTADDVRRFCAVLQKILSVA